MKAIFILYFLFLALLSGCSSSKISVRESEQFQGTAVMHYPMIAKIKIGSEKIKYVYTNRSNQCNIGKECDILAYYDALKELKIDGIIEPIYYHEGGMGIFLPPKITVIGYPYTYTEFREVTADDKELLSSPGSTWIPVQTNNRPYITNTDATPTWQIATIAIVSMIFTSTLILITVTGN
jgi:hypothetical protein